MGIVVTSELSVEVTRGGKQSSAALRGTEKPPWVLVSDAVSVLQNIWGIAGELVVPGRSFCSSFGDSTWFR